MGFGTADVPQGLSKAFLDAISGVSWRFALGCGLSLFLFVTTASPECAMGVLTAKMLRELQSVDGKGTVHRRNA